MIESKIITPTPKEETKEPEPTYPWVGIWNADTTPAGWEEFEGLIMLFIEKGLQVPLFIPRDDIIYCKIGERRLPIYGASLRTIPRHYSADNQTQMITIIVTEIDLLDHWQQTRYFKFDLDQGKDFCYRSRMSYNAFFNGMKRRNWTKPKHFLYRGRHDDEFALDRWLREKENPEFIELKSVWEFYQVVGFDYKKKKWNKNEDQYINKQN